MDPFSPWKPRQVFTPRSDALNPRMYVERPELEEALQNAILGSQHVLMHGESGSGKSWLYQRVLKELDLPLVFANLANAARLGSITAELQNVAQREGARSLTSAKETMSTGVSAVVAEGKLQNEKSFAVGGREPFEACLHHIRTQAGKGKTACLVLDNLEMIIDSPDLMSELANLIILLDDRRYAQYEVKLLIVGVPGRVREYFLQTPNRATVANRLTEIPEIARLTHDQCNTLVVQGFLHLLRFNWSAEELRSIQGHVAWVTDRIPQRVHEYCLALALIGEKTKRLFKSEQLETADSAWLKDSLSNAYAAVEAMMNERDTRLGRRNQTIYALGALTRNEFRLNDVEDIVRQEFPASTASRQLNISGMLSELADGEAPLIKRSPKGDAYVFIDPRFRMCIRMMLRKNGEAIEKIELG